VMLAGRRVAVFNAKSGWYAIDDRCPHLGGPLSDGVLADRSVICPLHERRFDLATGEALTGDCDAAAHRVEVRGTQVYVELAQDQAIMPAHAHGRADVGSVQPHREGVGVRGQ
jgi:nitrite reductase (NADH) small subunit